MIKSLRGWVLMLLALCLLAGCGTVFTQRLDAIPEWSENDWQELSDQLKGDQWQPKPDWSFWRMAETAHDEVPSEVGVHWKHPAERIVREIFEKTSWTHQEISASQPTTSKETSSTPPVNSLSSAEDAQKISGAETALWSGSKRELLHALAADRSLPGWNAAILIGLLRPQEGNGLLPVLWPLIEEPLEFEASPPATNTKTPPPPAKTSPKFRAAAAEACGRILAMHFQSTPAEDIDKLRALLAKSNLPDAVHVELLLTAGKCLPPRDIPDLNRILGLEKSSTEKTDPVPKTVRRAALQACLLHALRKRRDAGTDSAALAKSIAEDWPVNLTNLQHDEDHTLRSDLGRLLAIAKHPKAWVILQEQSRDFDPVVRQEALVSLGWLGSEKALEELRKQRKSEHELIRVAAVKGLAHWGPDELRPSLNPQEKSAQVRQEVAHQLGQFHDDHSAEMLRICLTDINPQVQQEAILQADKLPERLSVPLLLTALSESSSATRQLALSDLERRSGKTLPFPIFGTAEERSRETALLRQQWPQRLGGQDAPQTPSAQETQRQTELRIAEMRSELESFLNLSPGDPRLEVARERLKPLTNADVRWIEELVPRSTPEQNERLAQEILPQISPVYQALKDLRKQEIEIRRKGAEQLYQEGSKVSLSRMALLRLQQTLVQEQDSMVWRFCMLAVAKDGSPEALQIAQLAVNNSWPDIRVLGCDYIARHGTAEQALWIRGLFGDKNPSVQSAAVRAAIHCRNPIVLSDSPEGQPGLKRILTTTTPDVRVQVACCLCVFGDDQGYQELMRLSQNGDWMIRLQVVRGMAESGQTRFVVSLINLGWTEKHASVRLGILQALETLVPESQRPSGLASTPGIDQKLTLWATWWEKTRQNPGTTPAIVEAAP